MVMRHGLFARIAQADEFAEPIFYPHSIAHRLSRSSLQCEVRICLYSRSLPILPRVERVWNRSLFKGTTGMNDCAHILSKSLAYSIQRRDWWRAAWLAHGDDRESRVRAMVYESEVTQTPMKTAHNRISQDAGSTSADQVPDSRDRAQPKCGRAVINPAKSCGRWRLRLKERSY